MTGRRLARAPPPAAPSHSFPNDFSLLFFAPFSLSPLPSGLSMTPRIRAPKLFDDSPTASTARSSLFRAAVFFVFSSSSFFFVFFFFF
jgi:hypothetical protein